MIKHERFGLILQVLEKEKKVDAASLSLKVGVSEATIRRDITTLSQMGKLLKVHGGALPLDQSLPADKRRWLQKDEKYIIAQKVVKFFQDDMLIFLDGGSTNFYLASLVPEHLSATFITNSPTIIKELGRLSRSQLIMLGGSYDPYQEVVSGPEAVDMLEKMNADIYAMGVCSLHPAHGITTSSYNEAQLKEVMCKQARRVVALAYVHKLNKVDHYRVGELNLMHTLVTELEPDDDQLHDFTELVEEII